MIIVDCEQGSPEWFEARCGVPTASSFDKIITPTGKPSTQARAYMYDLIAERFTQDKTFTEPTEWMLRGVELETEARGWYEFIKGEVDQVGFVLRDDKLAGCSPDGISEGGLEIKCPKPGVHVQYMLSNQIPTKYIPQVQGCMWICEREWWDFVSYHPLMPSFLTRVYRDDKYIAEMEKQILEFSSRLQDEWAKLEQLEKAA